MCNFHVSIFLTTSYVPILSLFMNKLMCFIIYINMWCYVHLNIIEIINCIFDKYILILKTCKSINDIKTKLYFILYRCLQITIFTIQNNIHPTRNKRLVIDIYFLLFNFKITVTNGCSLKRVVLKNISFEKLITSSIPRI